MEVIDKTNGEIIESLISNLAKIVGQPLQIISDHGSDLKKGIELFIAKNPRTIYTYDFTHQVALYLKHELSNNQKFREFVHQCTVTRSQIQQTELSFLTPPAQRSKARYHNLDILINWGLKLLIYWKKQDFSLISNQFIIDRETLFILSEELDPNSLGKLAQILGTKASSCTSFEQIITETIGRELYQEKGQIILAAAAVGRRRFLAKFGWLFNYEAAIHIYAEILKVFDLAKKQFIQQGIHQDSQQDWLKATEDFPRSPWVQKAQHACQ